MSDIPLKGLRAGTPIGFLAAMGAFRLAVERREQLGEVRLRWERETGDWHAVFVTEKAASGETLLELLTERVCGLNKRPEFEWADQIKKNSPERFREAVLQYPDEQDWFAAFGSELALTKGTLQSTGFDMTGGQQKFLLKLRESWSALSGSRKEAAALLREALFGPWMYRPSKGPEAENSHSMGLDPSTILQGAFTAAEPAGIKDKRGVRGAIFLAFEALPFYPCVFDGRLRTAGFHDERGKDGKWRRHFHWCVWSGALGADTVKTLLLLDAEEWTQERGVAARYRSERISLNKDYCAFAAAQSVRN
ncbi:MAG: hypothetical protein IT167_21920 [Bryobacterales bacterium]|nr:hypothetical protein [Bryobacterales bacterium]